MLLNNVQLEQAKFLKPENQDVNHIADWIIALE